MAVFGEGGGSPSHSGGLLERSNSAGEGIRSMPNSSPLSPSPILRKSGSLTPAQSASASAAAAAAAAVRSSNGNGRDDDRRREFQRVKTVSFANLENVTDGDLLQGAAAGELPPSLQNDGAVSSPLEAPILCGVELDGGELLVMDDDTDHPSVSEASELEELFALNVNHWMRIRLIPMCLLLLVLTFAMWPLLAWSFDQQTTFDHTSTIGIMFNSAMAVTVVTSIALGFSGFCTATRNYAEHLTSIALLLLVTMWGVWNSMASYLLESQAEHANDFRSTEESTALEACTAMSYLYGLLPVVLIDVVLPSRTKYSWLIHVSFFGTSAASIVIRGSLNPRFIAPSFVRVSGLSGCAVCRVTRVVTYFVLALFLYLGRYAAEMHLRQTFVGWLDTRRRVDRLESDLKRQRSRGGVSTSVEQLVHLVKQMQESNQLALAAAADGLRPDLRSQLQESKTMLQQCLSILCTTTNLYAVNFGPLDNVEHMDIIRSLLNDKNALPKDWVRARDSLPSSLTQSETGPRRESNGEQTRNNSAPAGGKTVVSAGERLPSVPPPQASEKRPLGGAAVCVAEEIPMATGRRAVGGEAGKLLQQGVQLLPLPRSRRGSHAAEETPFSKPPEEGAEKNSTRNSVFSDMLQRPRRVIRRQP
ncbi:3 -cyclic nucleotide phosphodiesterase [Cyclospora cayetanensis]|uniref:3-cyclic nucleotide phosphodiesterase n=1 Tax=Cyclospora cayetanensis TaxID=88456 RepID=A0A1D3D0L5_9EIME|nr:3 -cyclic nucleotide phosphodiesterase [Cyclospora cayetanensis]